MWYAPVTLDEQRRRHHIRLTSEPDSTWPMTEDELTAWAGMFDVPSQVA
jgi:hypothetical protein